MLEQPEDGSVTRPVVSAHTSDTARRVEKADITDGKGGASSDIPERWPRRPRHRP
jgi:hypothetical protein